MSLVTTHVLDTGRGKPATGIPVSLFAAESLIAQGVTDDDGRVGDLGPDELELGTYRLVFDITAYDEDTFFPKVVITFNVADARHHHVPLLLSPFAYSTYRGS
jgi:5-hydroxyisourate hydrolase